MNKKYLTTTIFTAIIVLFSIPFVQAIKPTDTDRGFFGVLPYRANYNMIPTYNSVQNEWTIYFAILDSAGQYVVNNASIKLKDNEPLYLLVQRTEQELWTQFERDMLNNRSAQINYLYNGLFLTAEQNMMCKYYG